MKDHKHNRITHRLAAIMFTDIVGYTALMGKDEDRAFEVLGKNREIHSKFISQFRGTLIKEMGDGVLISFNTCIRDCAFEIQKANKLLIYRLRIRHAGDIAFFLQEKMDIFLIGYH